MGAAGPPLAPDDLSLAPELPPKDTVSPKELPPEPPSNAEKGSVLAVDPAGGNPTAAGAAATAAA